MLEGKENTLWIVCSGDSREDAQLLTETVLSILTEHFQRGEVEVAFVYTFRVATPKTIRDLSRLPELAERHGVPCLGVESIEYDSFFQAACRIFRMARRSPGIFLSRSQKDLIRELRSYGFRVMAVETFLRVRQIMSRKVTTLLQEATLYEAAERMVQENIGSVVIVKGSTPVGILTRTDLLRKIVEGKDFRKSRIGEHMSRPLTLVEPSTDIVAASQLMKEKRVKHLPVVQKGELVGILSVTDFAKATQHLAVRASRSPDEMEAFFQNLHQLVERET
jgi:CBS domain-containing protein